MDGDTDAQCMRLMTLSSVRQQIEQLLATADRLDESVLAVFLCHALDRADAAIARAQEETLQS